MGTDRHQVHVKWQVSDPECSECGAVGAPPPPTPDLRAAIVRLISAASNVTADPDGVPRADSSAWQNLDLAIDNARAALTGASAQPAPVSALPLGQPGRLTVGTDRTDQLMQIIYRMRSPDVVTPDEEQAIRNVADLIKAEAQQQVVDALKAANDPEPWKHAAWCNLPADHEGLCDGDQ